MPHTAILLTTPPECYKRVYVNKKRTYVRNENTERAAKAIVEVARREGLACWDLFASTGGKNSSARWRKDRFNGKRPCSFYERRLSGARHFIVSCPDANL